MKELFQENGRVNENGKTLEKLIDRAIEPLIQISLDFGYKHQDIEILIHRQVTGIIINKILGI